MIDKAVNQCKQCVNEYLGKNTIFLKALGISIYLFIEMDRNKKKKL